MLRSDLFSILADVVRFHTPSGVELPLARHIAATYLSDRDCTIDAMGNLLARPRGSTGRPLPLLNAHLDIHPRHSDPGDAGILARPGVISLVDGSDWVCRPSEPVQVGFDNKIGVALALALVRRPGLDFKVVFSTQEETGRRGIQYAIETSPEFFEDTSFVLTLDRHSSEGPDIIYQYKGRRMAPDGFLTWLERVSRQAGNPMYRRVGSPNRCADAYNISCAINGPVVNLSTGIYDEHTRYDRLNFREAEGTLRVVERCLREGWNPGIRPALGPAAGESGGMQEVLDAAGR